MLKIERVVDEALGPSANRSAVIQYVDENGEIHSSPEFKLNTYRYLAKSDEIGESILRPINDFLNQLTNFEQKNLYDYYLYCRGMMNGITSTNLTDKTRELSDVTDTLFGELNLSQRLVDFVVASGMPFPPLPKELRDHDTTEMTFVTSEYVVLSAMSLLCKLMSPIWGEYTTILRPPVADEINKELFCFEIVAGVFHTPAFEKVYNKLADYVKTIVIKTVNDQGGSGGNASLTTVPFIMSNSGFAMPRFVDLILHIVMVKKLVIYDLWVSDPPDPPNIMRYIYVNITETAKSKLNTMRKTPTLVRHEPQDKGNGSNPDNATITDNTARISKTTADIPEIAIVGIDKEIPYALTKYGLNRTAYNAIVAYYRRNPARANLMTQGFLASMFADRMDGSRMLMYPLYSVTIQLVVICQLYLIKQGAVQLAALLTSTTSDEPNVGAYEPLYRRISNNAEKTPEYRQAIKMFSGYAEKHNVGTTISWDSRRRQETTRISMATQLENLKIWILDYDHKYNVPPEFWAEAGYLTPPENGTPVQIDENVMAQVCQYFITIHSEEG